MRGLRVGAAWPHLSAVHPQLTQEGLHAARRVGTGIPITGSGGAFAWLMPGQHTALHRHLIMPEGRIFFAGEHVSLTHTWMQGTLESALQAVRDLLVTGRR